MYLAITHKQSIQNKLHKKISGIEQARIKKHLNYTLKKLQKVDAGKLPANEQATRQRTLDNLQHYIQLAEFPVNSRSLRRHPIFVDQYGNYCAVGYLLHAAGYDDIVDEIQQTNNLVQIDDIQNPRYIDAITSLGITMEEAAQIQPGYNWQNPVPVEPAPDYTPILSIVALTLYIIMQIFLLRFITRLNISNKQKGRLVIAYITGNGAIASLVLMIFLANTL